MTLEDLKRFNEENERDEYFYTIEILFYEKKKDGSLFLKDGDPCFRQTDDYKTALESFNNCVKSCKNELCEIFLKKIDSIEFHSINYEIIMEFKNRERMY